ncbi:helix-turn-helix transcriptional regulator [Propionicicella superfundia]|uniref:helix-turn-helix transcriptional regulator n=1 Tax=Propionicicella superfundia TaxID=348582 RepID=UPI0003F9B6DB|nr:WYL domain-containing protein [Propionicicella superfundia]
MTSQEQVRRILALTPYLLQHPGVAVAEVARVFGVTARQVRSDLEVLWMVGPGPGLLTEIDMDALDSEGVIHLSNASFLARPMRFTPDEALSLSVALRTVRELAAGEQAAVVDAAIAKLSGAAPAADEIVQVVLASGREDVRDALNAAIENGQAVRLVYDGARRGSTTEPVVDPAQLYTRDGVGYLRAWSHDAGAWRTYRLDRIAEATPTGRPVGAHPEPPADDTDWLARGTTVTLMLDRPARWVAEYYPVRSVAETPGGLRVELSVLDQGWLDALLLRLGGDATVVEDDAAAAVREAARAALAAYAGAGLAGS